MKKIFQRLIIFFVGLPVLLALVLLFPHHNHLLLNLVVISFSILGAMELRSMLARKDLAISATETIILGAISPTAWTIVVTFGLEGQNIIPAAFILGALWLLVSGIFTRQEKFDSYIGRVTAGFSVMIYPGLFLAWLTQMTVFHESGMIILVFLLITLLNDSMAWAFGMLFGKNNRGVFTVSPNKSVAGFIAGLSFSVMTGIAAVILIPSVFTSQVIPSLPAGALLGLGAGIAATLGDLGESAIKRSAGVKDSGSLILGRGGALDSIDSVALAAPVYYMLFRIFFLT